MTQWFVTTQYIHPGLFTSHHQTAVCHQPGQTQTRTAPQQAVVIPSYQSSPVQSSNSFDLSSGLRPPAMTHVPSCPPAHLSLVLISHFFTIPPWPWTLIHISFEPQNKSPLNYSLSTYLWVHSKQVRSNDNKLQENKDTEQPNTSF